MARHSKQTSLGEDEFYEEAAPQAGAGQYAHNQGQAAGQQGQTAGYQGFQQGQASGQQGQAAYQQTSARQQAARRAAQQDYARYGYMVGQHTGRKGATAYGAQTGNYAAYGKNVIDGHRKRTRRRWRVVFWIALFVLVAALAVLGYIVYGYWAGQQNYQKAEEASGFEFPRRESQVVLADLTLDWDALRAINPDIVAWVYFPGTNINYPVVQGADNDHYLKYDFYGGTNAFVSVGAIFLDHTNAADFSDANNVVYGHHLNDGTMFSALAGLSDQTKFSEARTVYVLTPTQNFRLRTFALVHCAADDAIVQTSFATPEDQAKYIQDKIDRSVVDVLDTPDAASVTKSFAFSTCDNTANNGRYVLFSYVEEQAAATNVSSANAAEAGGDQAAAEGAAAEGAQGAGTEGLGDAPAEGSGEVPAEDAAAVNDAAQAVEGV